jgi:CHASE3 domain sensor protein
VTGTTCLRGANPDDESAVNIRSNSIIPLIWPKPTQKFARKFHTPQILRSGWYTTWGVSLLLLIISIYGVNTQRQAIKTVGKDAAPSVLTAQQLQDSFAGMDASLASELLLKPGDIREKEVSIDFETNRKKIAARLVAAAKNITYPAEQEIVEKLQRYDGDYLLKLQEARDAHQRGDSVRALSIYQSAAKLMDEKIIPKAEELSAVNARELEKAYANQGDENVGTVILITIVGLILIAILAIVQIFLYRRMRRILNLPLLGATAIAVIFLGYTIGIFSSVTSNLKIAKIDAFDSLHALRKMRALSYKINADESRYLLDRANADKHERSFNEGVTKIIRSPVSLETIANDTAKGIPITGVTGLFADELNNITFAGEREAAAQTLTAFNNYLKIDKQIRSLNRSGKVAEAIALCIGYKEGESNLAFDRYKKIHTDLMNLNLKEFEKNIKLGEDNLNNFEVIATVALGSVAILTLFGLRPRLMEYL